MKKLLLSVALLVLLAGCGTVPTPGSSPNPTTRQTLQPLPTATLQPEPNDSVILHLNLGQQPVTVDPSLAIDAASIQVVEQLFLGLTALDPSTGEVTPELAVSWDVSPDGTIYTTRFMRWIGA